jgi:transposase
MYGREIRVVDKYYPSSQRCSSCGAINKGMKNLNQRELCCTCCGTIIDRDYNAALNILQECNKNNRRNGGVSLNILTINSKIFDRFITKDVISKISSLLGLSITQEATYPLGSW